MQEYDPNELRYEVKVTEIVTGSITIWAVEAEVKRLLTSESLKYLANDYKLVTNIEIE
jgi:hypothetical protein